MNYDAALEKTIDKILKKSEEELLESLKQSLDNSKKVLSDSLLPLEQEYDRIIAEGKKDADKIQSQIIGSSGLAERNKQILLVEESVEKVIDKAIEKLRGSVQKNYTNLMTQLIDEAITSLGTTDIVISTNARDSDLVKSILKKFKGATLSSDTIECIGGIFVKSKDGSMNFDNTIDARLERLKPVIRKDVATKFGR
ncbi:MAG: V-type ATP synthase subunit E [Marine Group I thaumarchaeote]|nr:MAG: V-type ATP synthase subunit E [Marine Group I thaumarchaeote]